MSNKLKDQLTENVPTRVKIVENKGEQHGDFKGKPTTSYWYKIELDGVVYDHSASPTEMQVLGLIHVGETAVVKKVKNKYGTLSCYWAPEDDVSARVTQVKPNTQVIREEKAMDDYNTKKEEKDFSIGIRGLFQAHVIAGKTNVEALKLALEANDMIEKAVKSRGAVVPSISPSDLPF